MNRALSRFCSAAIVSLLGLVGGSLLHADGTDALGPFRTQTIPLKPGWNAVYLEIEPEESEPSALFADTPIEIAAAYFRPVTAMEFVDSPNKILPDRKGWSVWYAPERDDTLLSDLYSIQAHQAYLVYTESAYTWQLQGTPFFGRAQWHPNAYSLVGFPIDAVEKPTIANFFAGVDSHAALKIYRMVDGRWNRITSPESTLMQPGEAYWTHSQGASSYAGPLSVSFKAESIGGLIYTVDRGSQELVLSNVSPYPQRLDLTLVPGANGQIPLGYVVTELNGAAGAIATVSVPLSDGLSIAALEAGESLRLELVVIESEVTQPLMTTTLVITSDAGPRIEVPIVSTRVDLDTAP